MSAQNPFQIPSCFKLDIEQRRRERFKKTVVTTVIVSAAVVIGLLIEGCVSERSQSAVTPLPPAAAQTQAVNTANPAPAQPGSQSIPHTSFAVQPCPVATVPKTATPVESPHATGEAVYLVRSGDSLTRIAKTHGTTVKALKLANSLTNDKIMVGEQLKIPSA
jgi:LysM repeat protein